MYRQNAGRYLYLYYQQTDLIMIHALFENGCYKSGSKLNNRQTHR